MYYPVKLTANVPQKMNVEGSLLLLDSTGAATSGVSITFEMNGSEMPTIPLRKAGFRVIQQYTAVKFESTVDADIGVFLSKYDVQLGGTNIINDADNPVNVLFAGTVEPVIGTIDNTEANPVPTREKLATASAVVAPVAVDDAGVVLLAADSARRGVRFYNAGANEVALIPVGGSFAQSVCRIQPGETWNENEAPGVAWNAVCDAGLASTINILKLS